MKKLIHISLKINRLEDKIIFGAIIFILLFFLHETGRSQTGQPMIMSNGVSVPSDFPHIEITTNDNPDTGYIFIDNRGGDWGRGKPYDIIFDNTGSPIWYVRAFGEWRDFKVQSNGCLSMMNREGYGGGNWEFNILDENYNIIKTVQAVNEYSTDEHELRVLENGSYLLIGRRNTEVEMNQYIPGDDRTVDVRETCVQEFDANDQLIRQYPAFDYFDPADLWPEELQKSWDICFTHMNSIDIDDDDNIILSSRCVNEVTKIDRQTKEIIWRLSGAHNQFTFINDPLNGFSGQHYVRRTGHNRYLLFDNGNFHNPPVSRAVEYQLDTDQMTATLIWEYRNPPGSEYSYYMGNAQRLPNGNTLINWAVPDRPKLTEVRPNGEVAFEMNFADRYESYRVYRFPWNGKATKPYLVAESYPDKITLIFNQFGDPDVDYYKIYGGKSSNPSTVIDTSKLTMKSITDLDNQKTYNFRVTSVNKNGQESDFSNKESVFVNFVASGENLVKNGDFSSNLKYWEFHINDDASASPKFINGELQLDIEDGRNDDWCVQITQENMPLIRGSSYLFEFDAYAEQERMFSAGIARNDEFFRDYSHMGQVWLTTTKQHFSQQIDMPDPTILTAEIFLYAGGSNYDVYIDNVSLKNLGVYNEEEPPETPKNYILYNNYPNPFNLTTTIQYTVPELSQVKITVYNIIGEQVKELINQPHEPNNYQITLDASALSSGLYFYKMDAHSVKGNHSFHSTHKMMFIK